MHAVFLFRCDFKILHTLDMSIHVNFEVSVKEYLSSNASHFTLTSSNFFLAFSTIISIRLACNILISLNSDVLSPYFFLQQQPYSFCSFLSIHESFLVLTVCYCFSLCHLLQADADNFLCISIFIFFLSQ